ncbi:MAG: tetratricopeptide repeat protein [Ekhidna sp.]|nr:tetratricopeptide repeat protein [Ekhidna sp.]
MAAEQGDADAQCFLGTMYYYGEGTLKDDKQAFYWCQKSAEQGFADAQYNLGRMYYLRQGTSKDFKQAAYWIRKAYNSGDEGVVKRAKEFWEEHELWRYSEAE